MLVNRELITVKIESTYGTDSTPTGSSDAVLVESLSPTFEGARMVERPSIKSAIGKTQQIYAGTLMALSFDVELKGSGAAGTAPEVGALLRACALGETISASTSVTYAPVSTGHESVTIYYYSDGMLQKMTGCRGTFSGTFETGSYGKLSFTMTGHVSAATDVTIATPTFDTTIPAPLIGGSFAAGGYAAVIASLSMDMGNEIATPPDMNAADGYSDIYITGRDVNGSYDPEQVLVATNDFIGDWKAGTSMAINTGVIGGTAGNKYAISLPYAYSRDIGIGDRDGLRAFEIGYGAAESSGDDEMSIIFT